MYSILARIKLLFYSIVFLLILSISSILLASNFPSFQASAQEGGVAPGETLTTNPKTRSVGVSATVADLSPPDTPILIRPENNSTISTNKPTFVWRAVEDTFGIDHYKLTVDGETLFDDIPTYEVDTNLYTLTYDEDREYYYLTIKNSLAEGNHTWKITVTDDNGNSSSSVTWNFTIDSQAPYILVTAVGSTAVSISSQDVSTIPVIPVNITETSPTLVGTGEANAIVDLVLSFSDGRASQAYTFTIDENGNWQHTLTNLPLDIIMYLSFTVTDAVGNISILENIPLIIPSTTVTAPTEPTFPTVDFPELPSIALPDITQPLPLPLPPPLVDFTNGFLSKIRPITSFSLIDNLFVLLMLLSILLTRLVFIVLPLKSAVSWMALKSALKILFFFPFLTKQKRGVVFEHELGEVIPYAPIILTRHFKTHTKQEAIFFSDSKGLIYSIPDEGTFSWSVDQPGHLFPTALPRPSTISLLELYKGETVSIQTTDYPFLFIPVNRYQEHSRTFRDQLLSGLQLVDGNMSFIFFSITWVITILFPTIANLVATILYSLVFIIYHLHRRRNQIKGEVFDTQKEPVTNCLVSIKLANSNQIIDFDITDSNGRFALCPTSHRYTVDTYKLGWVLQSNTLPILILQQVTQVTA